MSLIAQSPSPPTYVPLDPPIYPTFDVNLSSPLPPSDTFISTAFAFVAPPLTAFFMSLMSIVIARMIINSFKK